MTKFKNSIIKFYKDEQGATLIEYVLLAMLIIVACVGVITKVGGTLGDRLDDINDAIDM